jgi:hypothetical protein
MRQMIGYGGASLPDVRVALGARHVAWLQVVARQLLELFAAPPIPHAADADADDDGSGSGSGSGSDCGSGSGKAPGPRDGSDSLQSPAAGERPVVVAVSLNIAGAQAASDERPISSADLKAILRAVKPIAIELLGGR